MATTAAGDTQRELGTAAAQAMPPSLPPSLKRFDQPRKYRRLEGLPEQPVPQRGRWRWVHTEQPRLEPPSPARPPPAQEEEQ